MEMSSIKPIELEYGMDVESPCNGICTLEASTCKGCGRTDLEIFDWPILSNDEKLQIINRLK